MLPRRAAGVSNKCSPKCCPPDWKSAKIGQCLTKCGPNRINFGQIRPEWPDLGKLWSKNGPCGLFPGIFSISAPRPSDPYDRPHEGALQQLALQSSLLSAETKQDERRAPGGRGKALARTQKRKHTLRACKRGVLKSVDTRRTACPPSPPERAACATRASRARARAREPRTLRLACASGARARARASRTK